MLTQSASWMATIVFAVCVYHSLVAAQTPNNPPPPPPPGAGQGIKPPPPPPFASAVPPIGCGQPLTAPFGTGRKVSKALTMPYPGDVHVYVYGESPLQLSAVRALDGSVGTPPKQSLILAKQGYLALNGLTQGQTVTLEMDGNGNGNYWIYCQCVRAATTTTTTPAPTLPPIPPPKAALNLGAMQCGTGIIGDYGTTPRNQGTLSLDITMNVFGTMELYINSPDVSVKKLSAFKKPPTAPTVASRVPVHEYYYPVAETPRPQIQFLRVPDLTRGTEISFHIELEGQGKYYCITRCVTPAPTSAPTMSPTARPTPFGRRAVSTTV